MASVSRKQLKAILGRKVGMTQIFRDDAVIPVTVLEAGPCAVLQVRTEEKDGYSAYQVAFGDRRKKAKKPEQGRFDAAGVPTKHFVKEIPHIDPADLVGTGSESGEGGEDAEATGEIAPGAQLGVGAFKEVGRVDVQGPSKGRGFAGTIKRHGFQRGDAGHGSKNVREPGSTGQHTDPGRVFKGKRMAGQYGGTKTTARNLDVVEIDEEQNLMVVRGSVPGPNGSYVVIEESLTQP